MRVCVDTQSFQLALLCCLSRLVADACCHEDRAAAAAAAAVECWCGGRCCCRGHCCWPCSLCCAPEAGLVAAHDGGTTHAEDGIGDLHTPQQDAAALAASDACTTATQRSRLRKACIGEVLPTCSCEAGTRASVHPVHCSASAPVCLLRMVPAKLLLGWFARLGWAAELTM